MKVRFGLQKKFLLLFLVLTIILSSGLYRMVSEGFHEIADQQYLEDALGIGALAASILDGDDIVRYGTTLEKDAEYERISRELDNIKLQTNTYYLYVIYLQSETEGIYVFDAELTPEQVADNKSEANPLGTPENLAVAFDGLSAVLSSREPSRALDITTIYTGQNQETLGTIYVPLESSEGEVVGFVGVDVSMSAVRESIRSSEETITKMMLGLCVISFGGLLLLVRLCVVRPVKVVAVHADELANGKFGHEIAVKGRDEISEIARIFNRMNLSISRHLGEIQKINEAYYKFVPSKIFNMLQRTSITDVRLGDHVRTSVSILSYEVTNFEELIRQMDTSKMFAFMNQALQQAIPPVLGREGIIDHFREGGFTALYTRDCECSLVSAIEVCEKLRDANEEALFSIDGRVRIGIGITYGQIILGVVGHPERMSAISVARHTAISEYLGSVAAKYYADILITEAAAQQIPGFRKHYRSRFIGYLYDSYDKNMIRLYDVYDGNDEETIRLKNQTREVFESGVKLFGSGRITEARSAFVTVLRQFPKDCAAREYLYRCNQYYQAGDAARPESYIEIY